MSAVRPGTPGATRTCPHCRATILDTAMVLVIRNERGEEVNRHIVGVGALEGSQSRSYSVTVETNVVPASKGRRR